LENAQRWLKWQLAPKGLSQNGYGKIVEGMDVVQQVEAVGTSSGAPQKTVTVVDSGVLEGSLEL